jgi:hypothetical protein
MNALFALTPESWRWRVPCSKLSISLAARRFLFFARVWGQRGGSRQVEKKSEIFQQKPSSPIFTLVTGFLMSLYSSDDIHLRPRQRSSLSHRIAKRVSFPMVCGGSGTLSAARLHRHPIPQA